MRKTLWMCVTRTCNFACGYCVPAGTPVLMVGGAWKKIEDVRCGDRLVAFEDESQSKRGRRFVETVVTEEIKKRSSLIRFKTSNGKSVESTPDHEWLVQRGQAGQKKLDAKDVVVGDRLYWLSDPDLSDPTSLDEYRAGWLAGFATGDGSWNVGQPGKQDFFRVYSKDEFLLNRWEEYAQSLCGVGMNRCLVERKKGPQSGYRLWHCNVAAGRLGIDEARRRMVTVCETDPLQESETFIKGWLAGIFDAEGTRSELEIVQKDKSIAETVESCWKRLGFDPRLSWDGRAAWVVRVRGGLLATQRFATMCRPASEHKITLSGKYITACEMVTVESVETLEGEHDVYDVTTGARTFVIAGFLAWECYQGSHKEVRSDLSKMMSRDVLEKTAAFAKQWSPEGVSIIWYGGEPLTNWNLVKQGLELFENASHSITTNGSLLVPPIRAALDKHRVGVLFSLDGPPRIHNRSRPFYDGRGTWGAIPVEEILEWRPDIEIAWQLDAKFFDPASGEPQITPDCLDEMMALGFRNINFNLNWLARWSDAARWNLTWFFRHAGLKMAERYNAINKFENGSTVEQRRAVMLEGKKVGLGCNWWGKLERSLAVDQKMVVPCGTGLMMLGVSPEGWLYPSQEMVYTVTEPGRAPGTELYYRVGDVNKDPVIDKEVQARVSQIRTEQMRPPAPFDCNTCVAKSASIGGCHCRYVGQDGIDPANRFDVKPGYCESMTAAMAGLMMAANIARFVRPVGWNGSGPITLQSAPRQRA